MWICSLMHPLSVCILTYLPITSWFGLCGEPCRINTSQNVWTQASKTLNHLHRPPSHSSQCPFCCRHKLGTRKSCCARRNISISKAFLVPLPSHTPSRLCFTQNSQPKSFCWGLRVQPAHGDFRNRLRGNGPFGTGNPTLLYKDCLECDGVEGDPGILTNLTNELITKGGCESLGF